jgi:fused signal recognition particle receptor
MMETNQLSIIVKDSGLVESKAKIILEKFQDAFELADEWANKARAIKVTSGDQLSEIECAREGRKVLQQKRLSIERIRVALKEESKREGKAIDGIANVLKALYDPIEKYLYSQEYFVKLKEEEEAKKMLEEAEKKAEEDRIAKEKADAEELERLRIESVEKEKSLAIERAETERKAREERAKTDAIIAEQKRKADAERAEQEAILAEEREKAKKKQDAINEKLKAEREETARLEAELKSQITCPHCGKKFKLK